MIKRFGTLMATFAVASLALTTGPAFAGSHPATLSVSATTTSNCTTLSPGSITFSPAYDPFTYPANTPLQDSTPATFSTNCTQGDAINWTVDKGGNCNKGSVSNDRAMADASTHYLSYELFQDNGFSTPWAFGASCGAATAVNQTGLGKNTANTISVYGSIPGGQDAFVGSNNTDSYSDSVTVTVNY